MASITRDKDRERESDPVGETAVLEVVDTDGTDGFVWCAAGPDERDADGSRTSSEVGVSASSEVDVSASEVGDDSTTSTAAVTGAFEWCEPVTGTAPTESTGSSSSVDDPALDPRLATETRIGESDDEAVAFLAALRRDPTYGRWQRVSTDVGEE